MSRCSIALSVDVVFFTWQHQNPMTPCDQVERSKDQRILQHLIRIPLPPLNTYTVGGHGMIQNAHKYMCKRS